MTRTALTLLSLFALILLTPALVAQSGGYEQTGTIQATIGGEPMTFHTYGTVVDADLADEIEDEEAREFAQRVAGKEVHSASLMKTDAITAGDMVIVPATVWATISSRSEADPLSENGQLDFTFALDAQTYQPIDSDAEVSYYEESFGTPYWEMTEGEVVVESVEVVDAGVLRATGTISGVLSYKEDRIGPADTGRSMPIEATFTIEKLVGSDIVVDAVSGD